MFTGLLEPMLLGAGIGAIGSALGGRSPFKGAATGAALGAAGGAISGMMPASFGLKGAEAASAASGAGASTVGGNMLEPTLAPIGMANSFNMTTNAALPAVAGSSALGTAPLLTSAAPSAGGLLAQNSPEVMSGGFNISEYLTPQNMLGAALVAGQGGQPAQQIQAPSGGMSAGKAPSMEAITSLLATNRIPERQRRMNLFA